MVEAERTHTVPVLNALHQHSAPQTQTNQLLYLTLAAAGRLLLLDACYRGNSSSTTYNSSRFHPLFILSTGLFLARLDDGIMGKKSKRDSAARQHSKAEKKKAQEKSTITFYHFTRPQTVPIILEHGLRRGDVAISRCRGFNAVWLTTDPDPMKLVIGNDPSTFEKRKAVK